MRCKKIVVIALPFICCATGVVALSPNCYLPLGVGRNVGELHRVVIIGKDGRKTLAEYEKSKNIPLSQVKQRFSPTGLFSCAGTRVTGQLTGSNDVVTTASHVFVNDRCKMYTPLSPCFFKPINSNRHYSVNLSSLVFGCNPGNRDEDWAVVKLNRPIDGASFYDIPSDEIRIRQDKIVTQVTYENNNFKRKGNYPSTVQDCIVYKMYESVYFHDCDTGGGASGSAQLIDNTIVGINIGETTFKGSDGSDRNWNVGVPIRGEFLNSIKKLVVTRILNNTITSD